MPRAMLQELLRDKDIVFQESALFMLIFYAANITHEDRKPINSENSKFTSYIGMSDNR